MLLFPNELPPPRWPPAFQFAGIFSFFFLLLILGVGPHSRCCLGRVVSFRCLGFVFVTLFPLL